MNRRLPLFLACLLVALAASAQEAADTSAGIRDLLRVTFLSPGVTYEKRVGRFQSVLAEAFGTLSFSLASSSALGTRSDAHIDPALMLQYRFYYNQRAREAAGRRTANNNLNFVGPLYRVYWSRRRLNDVSLAEPEARAVHSLGAVWGIQRNYPKRFSLELSLGLGYYFSKNIRYEYNQNGDVVKSTQNVNGYTSVGQFSIGFWLGKRR
ncbi:hypothetical protein [Flaviaesturariibacter terrae]